jgi:hypothetical protein
MAYACRAVVRWLPDEGGSAIVSLGSMRNVDFYRLIAISSWISLEIPRNGYKAPEGRAAVTGVNNAKVAAGRLRLRARYRSQLNEQVKRNLDRFPADFMFQLTAKEAVALRSQIATGSKPCSSPMTENY